MNAFFTLFVFELLQMMANDLTYIRAFSGLVTTIFVSYFLRSLCLPANLAQAFNRHKLMPLHSYTSLEMNSRLAPSLVDFVMSLFCPLSFCANFRKILSLRYLLLYV